VLLSVGISEQGLVLVSVGISEQGLVLVSVGISEQGLVLLSVGISEQGPRPRVHQRRSNGSTEGARCVRCIN